MGKLGGRRAMKQGDFDLLFMNYDLLSGGEEETPHQFTAVA